MGESRQVFIRSSEPADPPTDLRGFSSIVGTAKVVGLGEATHGTREFFQLKHRLIRELVTNQQFNVVAVEAPYARVLVANDFVVRGVGNLRGAVWSLSSPLMDTEELRDLLAWLRSWNADHEAKVQLVGVDMQSAAPAVERLRTFLAAVETRRDAELDAALGSLDREHELQYPELPEEARAVTREALRRLVLRFDDERETWIARSSEEMWLVARQCAVVVTQAEHGAPRSGHANAATGGTAFWRQIWRDRSMAGNVQRILLDTPNARIAFWAHNQHVGKSSLNLASSGRFLAASLGGDYVAIGAVFRRGSFRVGKTAPSRSTFAAADIEFGSHTVDPMPDDDISSVFPKDVSFSLLDLRRAPDRVRDWLSRPRRSYEIGWFYSDQVGTTWIDVPSERFDALLFVDESSPVRALPR